MRQIKATQFFNSVRKAFGPLTQSQVEGFNTLIHAWEQSNLTDNRWFAYMLATVWHETDKTMQPIREKGGQKYLKSKPYWPYYGRGYVQLTWKDNYTHYGIAKTPDRALEPALAAHILIDGMVNGVFTTMSLRDYFGKNSDPVHARMIINGLDCAEKVAGYYRVFLKALV